MAEETEVPKWEWKNEISKSNAKWMTLEKIELPDVKFANVELRNVELPNTESYQMLKVTKSLMSEG